MAKIVYKVRTKSGSYVIDSLTLENTVIELKKEISEKTGIPLSRMGIVVGFPPKPLGNSNDSCTLKEAQLKSGESFNVEDIGPIKEPDPPRRPHILEENAKGGLLLRQVVPADNSCLFTSMGFVLGGQVDTTCGEHMRRIIAEKVATDSETYSEAILGKPTKDYCNWILKPESWGGAIELAVLSEFYGIEIAVVDTINAVINRFGEDKDYEYRVFLIFDGIHYDPLYRESFETGNAIQTMFIKSDEKVLLEAEELAHEAKSSKQFTDVNRFTLKCLVCQIQLTGQTQAQEHAKQTGHTNFGETAS